MGLRVITAPADEPVSLVEAKAHLRLEESIDDAYVTRLITAARGHVEKACSRKLLLQTVEVTSAPPCWREPVTLFGGELPDDPAINASYIDATGATQTLTGLQLVRRGDARCAQVIPALGTCWPTMAHREDALTIEYQVGWASPEDVPEPLRQAVLLMVSQLYEQRSPEITGTIATTLALSLDALMDPYRLFTI